jgi:uncharacterized lipoprotein YajG
VKKLLLLLLAAFLLTACSQEQETQTNDPTQGEEAMGYVNITAQEAKEIMDTQTGYVILDVRELEEYDEGTI